MWDFLRQENKSEYKKMILAFASLTEMFAQKADSVEKEVIRPIINSKYQETVFQRVFNATPEDIGNTSYDAAVRFVDDIGLEHKYLIGIKTFGYSSDVQKVAQFKANHDEWTSIIDKIKVNAQNHTKQEIDIINKDLYKELAERIARLRNMRIDSSASNIQGFSVLDGNGEIKAVYHVLMPSIEGNNPQILVGETSYDKINIDNITIEGCTSKNNPTNFTFKDGNHRYRFTSADSQLYMHFNNRSIVQESWDVQYADDAYSIFASITDKLSTRKETEVIESYSWKIEVQPYSGFNSFFGLSSKIGPDKRRLRIQNLYDEYNNVYGKETIESICTCLHVMNDSSNDDNVRVEKRWEAISLSKKTNDKELLEKVEKIAFRPKEELYIPIPNSKEFHKQHPDFFKAGLGKLKKEKNKWVLPYPKENNEFTLVFEPSGEEVECFITQDLGKAIESKGKQSILGEWLLRKVFLLDEYEPLTAKRLEEIGYNGMKLFKTSNGKIHLQFIWME